MFPIKTKQITTNDCVNTTSKVRFIIHHAIIFHIGTFFVWEICTTFWDSYFGVLVLDPMYFGVDRFTKNRIKFLRSDSRLNLIIAYFAIRSWKCSGVILSAFGCFYIIDPEKYLVLTEIAAYHAFLYIAQYKILTSQLNYTNKKLVYWNIESASRTKNP